MKKIGLILLITLIGIPCYAEFLGIKKATENVVFFVRDPLDSAGLPGKPDSMHIETYSDNNTAASYLNRSIIYPFSAIYIDTTINYGDTSYWFNAPIQDIDGVGANSELSIVVVAFYKNLPTFTTASVLVLSDSLNAYLAYSLLDTARFRSMFFNNLLVTDTANDPAKFATQLARLYNFIIGDTSRIRLMWFANLLASDTSGATKYATQLLRNSDPLSYMDSLDIANIVNYSRLYYYLDTLSFNLGMSTGSSSKTYYGANADSLCLFRGGVKKFTVIYYHPSKSAGAPPDSVITFSR